MAWTYRPSLDGLRSVAVYLVLLFHAGLSGLEGGFIGVDLFFVLSGFLVSNVILSEIDRTGRLDLGGFYARRVRRLLPAALVVVVATALAFLLVLPLVRRLPLVTDAQSALLYAANWNFLLKQDDYFADDVAGSPFLHFWSLAIEEQFYFVFPVVLLLLVLAARRRAWILPAALSTILALSLAAQLVWARVDMNWAYYGTDARLYQLMAGALLAVVLRGSRRRPPARAAGLVALLALAALLVIGSSLVEVSPSVRGIAATVASVTVIGGLMVAQDGSLSRLLSRPTPVYLGKVSYGTYLWHWPVILVLDTILTAGPLTIAGIALVLSTGLAALSFEVLETPIRKTAALHPLRWSTVLVGVTTSALVATTVVPAVLDSQRRPRLAASSVASAAPVSSTVNPYVTVEQRNASIPADLDWKALTAHPGDLPSCTVEDPRACVLVDGDGPHVTLVGDSHAKVLVDMFEKLARERGLTFSVGVVPGCPWQSGLIDNKLSRPRISKCVAARGDWYEKVLPKLDPDLVIFSGLPRDEEDRWDGRLRRLDGPTEDSLPRLLYETSRETVELVRNQGPAVLLLSHMPTMRHDDPLACLANATRIHQCEFELPPRPASDAYNRVIAALTDKVYYADIRDAFCIGAPRCLPIVDGVVVWRDGLHFSTEIAVHERREVWRRIKSSGAFDSL